MKGITRLPDIGEDDGIKNVKPEIITVKDYMRLDTGVAHLISQEASNDVHRVAFCGHKEPTEWTCSEIFLEQEFTTYRREGNSGIVGACEVCKERVELQEFGGGEL